MTTTTLPLLIQHMLQPGFYPHPVTEPIQLMQTHVSYVLLTGEYVYKQKKPLNFGFLDFSTLEKRQHFCHEELRLNQRGAAELYLDVLPITQAGEQFVLGGDGEPVEYAVKMQQFPQETLLSEMYDRGELTEHHLEQLAKVLADFHKKAPTNDYILGFGEVDQIRQAIDENYDQTVNYIGVAQTQQQFDETKAYTDKLFAEQQALFASRVKHKLIRECHGDVHLRNICFWKNKVLLFDCIEFNEPFRFVDVMFDVAYIVMDFDARNRPDLSNLFLNTYIEQTGDWEGLQVLPLEEQAFFRAFRQSRYYAQYDAALDGNGGVASNYASACDVLRYPMLHHEGGLYMDVDDTLLAPGEYSLIIDGQPVGPAGEPIDQVELSTDATGLLLVPPMSNEKMSMNSLYNSSLIGSHPGNPTLEAISEEMLARYQLNRDFYDSKPSLAEDPGNFYEYARRLSYLTGPALLSDVVDRQLPSLRILRQLTNLYGMPRINAYRFVDLPRMRDSVRTLLPLNRFATVGGNHSWSRT